ncbi:TPA: conjugal transfer protein [Streptococcus agalactiae]
MKKINKMNKKTGILIGAGLALSIGAMTALRLKKKMKKVSDFEADDFDFDFDEIEEESFVKDKLDTENEKDDEREELYSLEDEYLEYEAKPEEEKQKEFRVLVVDVLSAMYKEILSMKETLDTVKKDIYRIGEVKVMVEELENCKEEIISLWEHMEKLSEMREDIIGKKNRG